MFSKLAIGSAVIGAVFAASVPSEAPYISRPEIIPSELDVQINKGGVENSYIFLCPWNPGDIPDTAPYFGPHIYDKDGNLVWTGYGLPQSISNFTPIQYHRNSSNTTGLSYWTGTVSGVGLGFGSYREMDNSYRITENLGFQSPFLNDFHEFSDFGDGTAVFSTYQAIPYNLSTWNSSMEDGWVYQNVINEIDTSTDEVIFLWNSIEHIPISESLVLNQIEDGKGKSNEYPFDYLHMNSIDKDRDGNYLISGRHAWSLYYIDGKSGDLIWTLNSNPEGTTNWNVEDDATFAYQHNARFVDAELIGEESNDTVRYISLFDNESNGHTPKGFRDRSRGIILKLTTSKGNCFTTKSNDTIGKVELFQEYKSGDAIDDLCTSQGSVQVLDNGNVFVGWGANPGVSEYTLDGDKIFEAVPKDSTISYRAFKGNWTGKPFQDPAIVANAFESNSSTVMYFSYNGATEVKKYNLYGGNSTSEMSMITQLDKVGFQGIYTAKEFYPYVKIEALDSDGKKLGDHSASSYLMNRKD
ncbi:unnamed protein product [Debaryomyces tyrocola]|nr:unnamed protein product [Debaryomyces tyrocola]